MRFSDCGARQALQKWRRSQKIHRAAAAGFTPESHFIRIAAERSNVIPDTLDGGKLVKGSVIAGSVVLGFLSQIRMRHPSNSAAAVIHADNDDSLLRGLVAIVDRFGRRTVRASTAVDPDHHRQLLSVRCGWSPD